MPKRLSNARRRYLLKVVASPLFRHNTHPGVRWTGVDTGPALLTQLASRLHVVESGTTITFIRLGAGGRS